MSRYIDADKLHYSRVRIMHDDGTIGGYNAVVMSAEIKDAPTADVQEVRHGRWIKRTPFSEKECSNCNKPPKMLFGMLPDYCPWCGAKMDLGRSKG